MIHINWMDRPSSGVSVEDTAPGDVIIKRGVTLIRIGLDNWATSLNLDTLICLPATDTVMRLGTVSTISVRKL